MRKLKLQDLLYAGDPNGEEDWRTWNWDVEFQSWFSNLLMNKTVEKRRNTLLSKI